MNHRERFLSALRHKEPDRVPWHASLTEPMKQEFQFRTGCADPAVYWDWDLRSVRFLPPDPGPDLRALFGRYYANMEGEWVLDWQVNYYPPEWGVATRRAHFYHLDVPLAPMRDLTSVAEIEAYPFPDYIRDWRHDHLESQVQGFHREGYPVSAMVGWIFQTAWTLRTRERLFMDFYDRPEFAEALLERITAIRIAQGVRFAQAGVDCVGMYDDVGVQNSMIMSPNMWRQWIKPRMAALIQAVRQVNPDILFRYHSDGLLTPIIPDLIEIGVSSLITVQPESMDPADIKRRFGAHICLEGTMGLQSELAHGSPDDVRCMVKAQCEALKPGGGFVASPSNSITPDIPWDNLVALFEALDEYGRY